MEKNPDEPKYLTYARLGEKEAAAREMELAAKLEREEKEQRRTVLRLLDTEPLR